MKKIFYVFLALAICGAFLSAFTLVNEYKHEFVLDGTYVWKDGLDFSEFESGNSPHFLLEGVEFTTSFGEKFDSIYYDRSQSAMYYVDDCEGQRIFDCEEGWLNYISADVGLIVNGRTITFDNKKVSQEFYEFFVKNASKAKPVADPSETDGPSAGDPNFEDPNIAIDPPETDGEAENPAMTQIVPPGADLPVIDPGMEGPVAE